jgi:hypothetical protein
MVICDYSNVELAICTKSNNSDSNDDDSKVEDANVRSSNFGSSNVGSSNVVSSNFEHPTDGGNKNNFKYILK